jgi:hypothetical protein
MNLKNLTPSYHNLGEFKNENISRIDFIKREKF